MKRKNYYLLGILCFFIVAFSGCAKNNALLNQQALLIDELTDENKNLLSENDRLRQANLNIGRQAEDELARAKAELEEKLKTRIAEGSLEVGINDRGLVVTVLNKVLFDPGKAELKSSSQDVLDHVAGVLKNKMGNAMIYVDGHTDSDPIKKSTWRSNWELSSARALEVVHYFVEKKGLNPKRIAATGYGEHRPLVSNNTREGKMKNRRVEIVVSSQ